MFSKTPKLTGGSMPGLSFVGAEVTVGGDIAGCAQLHIDGRIDGNICCASLVLGAGGTVAGNIVAETVRLAGLVEGAVEATTVMLESSARVRGDITYGTIAIAAGAQIEGRLSRKPAHPAEALDDGLLIATPAVTSRAGARQKTGLFASPRKAAQGA
jgi:cytoskeletal protein CcmA (bactofilin family)